MSDDRAKSGEFVLNMIRKLLRDHDGKPKAIYVQSDWMRNLKHHIAGMHVLPEGRKAPRHGFVQVDGVYVWSTNREGVHVH